MRAIIASFGALAFATAAAAQTIPMTPDLQKVIDGAKQEKELVIEAGGAVLGGGDERIAPAMKKMFGVDFAYKFTPGGLFGVIGNKVQTEFRAGQRASTDVWLATAPQIVPLLKVDMWRKVDWDKLYPGRIKPEYIEANGTALRITTSVPGVLYNKQRAPEFAQVRMMDDLLKPEYKGKFGTTSFAAGFDVLLGKDAWGEEKVSAFLVKFAKQAAGILPCGGEDRIASGEFLALALDCAGGTQLTARYKDHLALQVPADNAQRRLSYLMVPKNAAHPNLAILYTLFFASPEGQQISRESWGLQLYEFEET